MLFVPEGFAHGFQTLTENCEMLYFDTAFYRPDAESGLNPQDPELKIKWPAPVCELSARDAAHPIVTQDFSGVRL
jgi:dTDP-4-dehydrorhamnose 3,5-epimerase